MLRDNLQRRYLLILQEDAQLQSIICKLISANSPIKLDPLITYKLQSMDLIKLDGDYASITCDLYCLYFQRQLCISNDFVSLKLEELQKNVEILHSNSNITLNCSFLGRRICRTCIGELDHSI